ncbi:hypothetical protein RIF29_18510 [Crotalaria pallida]|uniref:Uncharacterized protein n=1 Tax=Crotalaria pallida TaxID=3830 RepID=A0AAN9IG94_CROPI
MYNVCKPLHFHLVVISEWEYGNLWRSNGGVRCLLLGQASRLYESSSVHSSMYQIDFPSTTTIEPVFVVAIISV